MSKWTTAQIPPQTGKVAIVTGATGGLGYETALALAEKGGTVILAGRSATKGADAVARIQAAVPGANVRFAPLDLADLASVAAFVEAIKRDHACIDLLVNNAGLMWLPTRQTTKDGFEMQIGTNYLGHFALTLPLIPLLRAAAAPRIVNLTSLTHRQGAINLDDLQSEKAYGPGKAYAQSKLAMILFTAELKRRSEAEGWHILANAAHPGWARTDLVANGPASGQRFSLSAWLTNLLSPYFGQSAAAGALPTLFAATAPEAVAGQVYGPDGFSELKGSPAPATVAKQAKDAAKAQALWTASERLTGVKLDG